METFEDQIQPFIKPLIERIQALQAQNKLLKSSVEQLKTLPQKLNTDNKSNRTHTQSNFNKTATTRPPTTKPIVEPKPVINIKKQPKLTQKPVPTTAEKTRPSFPAKKQTKDNNQVKQPKTDRKEPQTKVVTSPKPLKGKQSTPTSTGVVKRPVIGEKTTQSKQPKPTTTKVPPPKVTQNKNPKVIAGGKGKQVPKVQTKTGVKAQDKKQQPKNQQKVEQVVVSQPIAPMIQSVEINQQTKTQQNKVIQPVVQKKEEVAEEEIDLKNEPKQEVLVDVAPVEISPIVQQQSKKDELLAQQQAQNTEKEVTKSQAQAQAQAQVNVQPQVQAAVEQPPAVEQSNEAKHQNSNPAQEQQQQQMI